MTTAAPPLATLHGIRSALVNAVIELDALGNRAFNVSPNHRSQATAIQAQARQLAVLLHSMGLPAEERAALKLFFGFTEKLGRPRTHDELDDESDND